MSCHTRFAHFVPHLKALCSRPEAASDVISSRLRPIVLDKLKPFSRNSTRSRQRQYFLQSFRFYFRPEVDNDVISGVAVDNVGTDVRVKFGRFMSNSFSRYLRSWFRVEGTTETNEHDEAYTNKAFCLKTNLTSQTEKPRLDGCHYFIMQNPFYIFKRNAKAFLLIAIVEVCLRFWQLATSKLHHVALICLTFRLEMTPPATWVGSKSRKHVHFGLCSGRHFSVTVQPISKKVTVLERVIQVRHFLLCRAQVDLPSSTHYINGYFCIVVTFKLHMRGDAWACIKVFGSIFDNSRSEISGIAFCSAPPIC